MSKDDRLIFLDLDGMAADLYGKFLEMHNLRHGTSYTKEDVEHRENGEGLLDATGNFILCEDYLHEDRVFENLDPIKGAPEAVKHLQTMGKLYIASAPSRNPDSASDKIRWVTSRLGVDRKRIMLLKDKYLLRGDVFLDDFSPNVINFRRTNPTAFIGTIAYSHNAGIKDIVNVRADDYLDTEKAWATLVNAVDKHLTDG